MLRYIGKRLLQMIPVLIGIAFIIFFIMDFTPGDPARLILGQSATAEAVDQLTEEMGLNAPFFTRFFRYIYNAIVHLDFGVSYRTMKPVFDDVFTRFPVSIYLALCGMIGSTLFGIPLGVLSAVKQYSKLDTVVNVVAMTMVAMPPFWVAMVLILVFSLYLGLLPSAGAASWLHYILPTITLTLANGSAVLRITRSSMLETIRMDYVRTAQAKGVPRRVIIFKHAFKNALLPVITTVGYIFGSLLGGAIVSETVFAMPGLGSLIVLSIKMKDIPVVMASIIWLALSYGVIMLIVDLMYAFIDPRIKAKYQKG
ncbi:MAG TPA: ABC transporter permease [Bacillota bacterium]|nr:ABC transporter permease [Bacillota bacterium]